MIYGLLIFTLNSNGNDCDFSELLILNWNSELIYLGSEAMIQGVDLQ